MKVASNAAWDCAGVNGRREFGGGGGVEVGLGDGVLDVEVGGGEGEGVLENGVGAAEREGVLEIDV